MFQTVELMDIYYERCKDDMPASDLQLTAVTCFFIAAKNIMVEPFNLQIVMENMCYSKYDKHHFLEKEKEIRNLADFQIE